MNTKLLSAFQIKMIGIITMTIDHVGQVFFPEMFWMRMIGRLAFPIFAWMIAMGYIYTKNLKKYFIRLFILALISQIPFTLLFDHLNVIPTLMAGLLSIYIYEKFSNWILKLLTISFLFIILTFFEFDYRGFGMIMVLFFYIYRKNEYKLIFSQTIIDFIYTIFIMTLKFPKILYYSSIQILSLLCLPIIFLYNNKQGIKAKWLFYAFYPGHLILIYIVKSLI